MIMRKGSALIPLALLIAAGTLWWGSRGEAPPPIPEPATAVTTPSEPEQQLLPAANAQRSEVVEATPTTEEATTKTEPGMEMVLVASIENEGARGLLYQAAEELGLDKEGLTVYRGPYEVFCSLVEAAQGDYRTLRDARDVQRDLVWASGFASGNYKYFPMDEEAAYEEYMAVEDGLHREDRQYSDDGERFNGYIVVTYPKESALIQTLQLVEANCQQGQEQLVKGEWQQILPLEAKKVLGYHAPTPLLRGER